MGSWAIFRTLRTLETGMSIRKGPHPGLTRPAAYQTTYGSAYQTTYGFMNLGRFGERSVGKRDVGRQEVSR